MQSATNTAQAETWEQRQEREGRERLERLAWFNDKMKNVAALLGAYTSEPWAWQEPEEPALWNPSGSLVGPDDKEIHATLDGYRKQGRIALSGTYPRDKAGRYYGGMQNQRAAITVAADKCEGKIAREIKSRLLPTYLAELAKIRARIKKSDDHDALSPSVFDASSRETTSSRPSASRIFLTAGRLLLSIQLLETHNKTAAAVGAQTYTEDELGFLPMRTKVWTNDLKLAGGMISSIQTGAGWVEIELRLPLDAALELLAQARPAGKEA